MNKPEIVGGLLSRFSRPSLRLCMSLRAVAAKVQYIHHKIIFHVFYLGYSIGVSIDTCKVITPYVQHKESRTDLAYKKKREKRIGRTICTHIKRVPLCTEI